MGWTSDEDGETSAYASESDSFEDVRPLKKARYVWQIKGKYHIKKSEDKCANIPEGPVHCTCNEFASTSKEGRVASQPLTCTGTASLNSSVGSDVINMPQRTSPYEWFLHRWQARQVARSFVDNTINRVLEDMGLVPLTPGNAAPPPLLEDGTEQNSIESREEDHNDLEDEAVLMAIHRHGLQRPSTLSQQQRHRQGGPVSTTSSDAVVAEHGNFLDAAVAVAIEKKGLGTLSSAVAAGTTGDNG